MSRPPLTSTQDRVLRFIESYIALRGFAPSILDIAQGVGLNSKSSVSYQLGQLVRKGYITRDAKLSRAMTVVEEAA